MEQLAGREANPTAHDTLDEAPLAGEQPPEYTGGPVARATPGAWAGDERTRYRVLMIGVVVFVASIAVRIGLDLASPGQRWGMLDLQIYRWAGQVVRHSGDLYGGHFPYHHLRFTYPPITALIFAVLSVLPISALGWIFTALSIVCLGVSLWLTWGALGYRQPSVKAGVTLMAAGVTLWLGPVQQTLGLGQVNLILMAIIIADFCLPDTAWTKGIGVGIAAAFKLTPLIFIPYLLLTRRFRAALVSVATFMLAVVVSLILLPGQASQFWFSGLFLDSDRTGNNAYVGNQSLHGALSRLIGDVSAARPYWVILPVMVGIFGLLLAAWWARCGYEMIGVLICALTGLLVSPISWTHHWVWAAPGLIVVVDALFRSKLKRSPLAWFCAAALAVPFFVVPQGLVPISMAQGHGARGAALLTSNLYIIVGLVVLCLAAFALKRSNRARGMPVATRSPRLPGLLD